MIIETRRLILREMTEDDFDALYRVLADSDIMQHYPYTFDENRVKNWIVRNIERYRIFGFGLWAVCLKETGEMIGDCGLTMQSINGQKKPEIGYHIRADRQRNGYAKEAAIAVRDWAFRNTPFDALYSYMLHTNEPSCRTAIAYGCKQVDAFRDELNRVTKVFAVTRAEWMSRSLPTGQKFTGAHMMNHKSLVVIDLQNDITKNYREIIGNVNRAIDRATAQNMAVIYIKHNNLSGGTRTFKPDTRGAELVPELHIVSEHIFVKTKSNALTSEEFVAFIKAHRLTEFYIAGADATACVKSTCYNMIQAGYTVHVLSDCVTSYDKKKLPEMMEYYACKGCTVDSLDDVL